ncbi:MAG: cytochrome c oxidase accessory protein CcoG, partial [Burkholderiales bacterium]|nr:cytochrome c oxidase accessory protein CcoG [Burkholderiales bacterium]MDE2159464.1 cytochrome c oxidase accessory protein CcoG [Burkholderiales bacterium]
KIYPRAVSGWFARWRWIMAWLTQIVFYGGPWLTWNGRQALLFDLDTRVFYVFGLVLQPQDFIWLAALLIIAAMALFFFTAVAGRLWCGYACPQSVYTEIYLWIERRFEGDRQARMRLDAAPWSPGKLGRKAGKQACWIAIGLYTGYTFVGYFTPMRHLAAEGLHPGFTPWEWFWILFYGFATYGNAGYMREQVCKYMCPYARFQSALIDADSMVIAYDRGRGDPRGSRPRKTDPKTRGLGDCIDCTLCVQVCPTGIDIRNGLQNECIGCAACIDVCDDVMGKMGYAPGLIRYATENGVEQGLTRGQMLRRTLRPRVLVYGALLALLCAGFVVTLDERAPFKLDIVKDRGTLAREVEDGAIENVYVLHIANSTEQRQQYRVAVSGLPELRIASAAEVAVDPVGFASLPVRVTLPPAVAQAHRGHASPIVFEVTSGPADHARRVRQQSTFYVPE